MDSNFTTGIPEIDRLTGSKIENGSFLLAAGNDDEGMLSFLAEIENQNERRVGKDEMDSCGCRIVKMKPDHGMNWNEFCNPSENENRQESFRSIWMIESISEFFSYENTKLNEEK